MFTFSSNVWEKKNSEIFPIQKDLSQRFIYPNLNGVFRFSTKKKHEFLPTKEPAIARHWTLPEDGYLINASWEYNNSWVKIGGLMDRTPESCRAR